MLKIEGKNMNFNGASMIDDETAAMMSAIINENGELFLHCTVTHYNTYANHKDTINADFIAFGEQILESMNNGQM